MIPDLLVREAVKRHFRDYIFKIVEVGRDRLMEPFWLRILVKCFG
jgi:hypothetical protein